MTHSFYYFPHGDMAIGGIVFVFGAIAFLFADIWDWWKNNRVGCICYKEHRLAYERSIKHYDWEPEDSEMGKLQRAENGLNFALNIFGSFLYLLGSFFFLPPYTYILEGIWIFIAGSAVIMIAQVWKVYRNFYLPYLIGHKQNFDWNVLLVDVFVGLGGFSYFFGSIFFLPWSDTDGAATVLAANWFLFGGLFFTLSGVFLIIRYFCYDSPLYSCNDSDSESKVNDNGSFEGESVHINDDFESAFATDRRTESHVPVTSTATLDVHNRSVSKDMDNTESRNDATSELSNAAAEPPRDENFLV